MKSRTLAIVVAAGGLMATGAAAAERTVTLKVANMYCALCGPTVKKSLERIEGVTKVQVDVDKELAVVSFDDAKASIDTLTKATTAAGYPSQPAP